MIPVSEGRRLQQAARGATMFVELHGGHIGAIDRSRDPLDDFRGAQHTALGCGGTQVRRDRVDLPEHERGVERDPVRDT